MLNTDVTNESSLLSRANMLTRTSAFTRNSYSMDRDLDTLISVEKPTCPEGFCMNSETKSVYMFNDACQPEKFNKAGCDQCMEKVECQFTK